MNNFQVTIQDPKQPDHELTCTLPFLPLVGNHIIVEGVEFKVKAMLINYDDMEIVIKGIVQ